MFEVPIGQELTKTQKDKIAELKAQNKAVGKGFKIVDKKIETPVDPVDSTPDPVEPVDPTPAPEPGTPDPIPVPRTPVISGAVSSTRANNSERAASKTNKDKPKTESSNKKPAKTGDDSLKLSYFVLILSSMALIQIARKKHGNK